MKTKILVCLILLSLGSTVMAERPLERTEILDIFQSLTSQPRKTWIPSGTISARHSEYRAAKTVDSNEVEARIKEEIKAYSDNPNKLEVSAKLQAMKLEAIPFNVRYRLSNEYTMTSDVIIKFDGTRFYWEIKVDSRTDSVVRQAELADNTSTEEFKLDWNKRRVFAWDGEKYTTYFLPGNHAIVTGSPSNVNGPLTAGVIPWGYGRYSYDRLWGAKSSAVETSSESGTEVQLHIVADNIAETIVLDAEKDFALKVYSVVLPNGLMVVRNCSGYRLVGMGWCPTNVTIEQYDTTENPAPLKARDVWDFDQISNGTPAAESFNVDYEYDALIEDYRFDGSPLQYRYSPPEEPSVSNINVDELMQDRLEAVYSPGLQAQNCATLSLKYACKKLGVSPSWEQLGQLVHGEQSSSTLYEMQEFAAGIGLESLPVKTDLETLRNLGNSQAILHLPADNHYAVLGGLDHKYIRLLDLGQNNFYYRMELGQFARLWDGTALLIGNRLDELKGNLARIEERQLHTIVGAAPCQSCDEKIQNSAVFECDSVAGDCGDKTEVFERWGCVAAASGECTESSMVGSRTTPCGPDLKDPSTCTPRGVWDPTSISACR
jgi:hypothetical protein